MEQTVQSNGFVFTADKTAEQTPLGTPTQQPNFNRPPRPPVRPALPAGRRDRFGSGNRRNREVPPLKRNISTAGTRGNGQGKAGMIDLSRLLRKNTLKMIPLGGLGEIGKNMMAYEYGDDIIIVDMGIMFPEAEMFGVDYIIPDISYLLDKLHKIRGVVFTHGHEDHIGSVPYLLKRLNNPVLYGTKLTAAFIEAKLEEFEIKPNIKLVNAGDIIQLGAFKIEFIPFAHTIPDDVALLIETPVGKVFHLTDFKLDPEKLDFAELEERMKKLGDDGDLLALLLDSTNVEYRGASTSEKVVAGTMMDLVRAAKGRVIVTSFSSSIERIQSVVDAAKAASRKVALSGRSMEKNVNIAMKLGYLKIPDGILVDIRRIGPMRDNELVIMTTGSQGEEYSALVRMASGEHRHVKIKRGDTVIISASAIPGNERSISNTINNLFREGADVFYGSERAIHASGHAKREDLAKVINLTKPKYFIPIHGEYRHLVLHSRLAEANGVAPGNAFIVENGMVVEFGKKIVNGVENNEIVGRVTPLKVPAGYVLVDGLGVGDVGQIVLRDRQAMAKDGIFVVILTVDHATGKLLNSPDIISRGFIYMREREDLVYEARQEIRKIFTSTNERYPLQWDYIKRAVRDEISEFLYKKTERRPMVIPVVIEV